METPRTCLKQQGLPGRTLSQVRNADGKGLILLFPTLPTSRASRVERPRLIVDSTPTEPENSRFRSTSFIALGSAVPASAPALALTGSIALCALVAVLVVACIGLAALVI